MNEGLDVSTLIKLLESFKKTYGKESKVYLQTYKTNNSVPAKAVSLRGDSEHESGPKKILITD